MAGAPDLIILSLYLLAIFTCAAKNGRRDRPENLPSHPVGSYYLPTRAIRKALGDKEQPLAAVSNWLHRKGELGMTARARPN